MKTTQPIFEDGPIVIRTPRLLLHSIQMSHLEGYHEVRSDPENMRESYSGFPDADHDATLKYMQRWLPPKNLETLQLSIFDMEDNSTSDRHFIGYISVRQMDGGGLELGYGIRRADWGKGYATEALRAMLAYYWKLDRCLAEDENDWPELKAIQTVDQDGRVREALRAMISVTNIGSRRVLEKCGFKLVEGRKEMPEPDHRGQEILIWYYLERPSSSDLN